MINNQHPTPHSPKAVDYSAISDDELDFDSSPAPPSASPGATPKKERKEDEENSQDDSMMDIILPTISKEDIILPSMTESETGSEQKLDSSELDSDVAKKRDKKKRHKERVGKTEISLDIGQKLFIIQHS